MDVFPPIAKKNIGNFICIKNMLLMLSLIFTCGFSDGERYEETTHFLHLKRVITNLGISIDSTKYEYGKELYPEYSYHGLPDNFLIRKSPDISIRPDDIRLVEISRDPFAPASMSAYRVAIHFNPSAAKKLSAYTRQNLNERIALEIDGKIFVIAKILDVVEDEIYISVARKTLREIESEIRKISSNVILK